MSGFRSTYPGLGVEDADCAVVGVGASVALGIRGFVSNLGPRVVFDAGYAAIVSL